MINGTYSRDYRYLDEFFDSILEDVGPTLINSVHDYTSDTAISRINTVFPLSGKSILDVGCGIGRDIKKFEDLGANAIGITVNEKEWLNQLGTSIFYSDQNFIYWSISGFDLVYASHVLEHSPIPLFTLLEYKRILNDDGLLYVEVPSDKPWAIHNQNHYSIFCKEMWKELFNKAGFELVEELNLQVLISEKKGEDPYIKDEFWGFLLKKKNVS